MKSIGDKIIVEYTIYENKSSGGIVLTGNAMSNPHQTVEAKVLSIGDNVHDVVEGDIVLVQKHSVTLIEETKLENFDTKTIGSVRVVNVLAIVEK